MATKKLAARKYLSFEEAIGRLNYELNDLRDLIASGALRPSIYVNERCSVQHWVQDESESAGVDAVVPASIINHEGHEVFEDLCGWHYLQWPWTTGPFACSFKLISKEPLPVKHSESNTTFYSLPRIIPSTELEADCVFMICEIERFEAEIAAQNPMVAWENKELKTKERNNLLSTIAVLVKLSKLELENPYKTASIIENMALQLGVTMNQKTIQTQLTRAKEAMDAKKR